MRLKFAKAVSVLLIAAITVSMCFGCRKRNSEEPTTMLIPVVDSTSEPVSEEVTVPGTTGPTETEQVSTDVAVETFDTENSASETTGADNTATEASTAETAVTEASSAESSGIGEAVSKKPWDLLNDEVLNPTESGYTELDNLLEIYMKRFADEGYITEGMSNYQTVRGIYLWFIERLVYNRGMNVDAGKYSSSDPQTTPEEVLWATDLFNTGQGCCYNYSSAFMYIMRYLGYDAHLVSGQVASYNGGTTPHCWVYINLAGEPYTFDPDVDMNYYWRDKNAGVLEPRTDVLFCKPMDEMNFFYTPEKFHEN